MLDHKMRFLPSISGIQSNIGYFRHAYCQSNFVISNFKLKNPNSTTTADNVDGALINFCQVYQLTGSRIRLLEVRSWE